MLKGHGLSGLTNWTKVSGATEIKLLMDGYTVSEIYNGYTLIPSSFKGIPRIESVDDVGAFKDDGEAAAACTKREGLQFFGVYLPPYGREEYLLDTKENRARVREEFLKMGIIMDPDDECVNSSASMKMCAQSATRESSTPKRKKTDVDNRYHQMSIFEYV